MWYRGGCIFWRLPLLELAAQGESKRQKPRRLKLVATGGSPLIGTLCITGFPGEAFGQTQEPAHLPPGALQHVARPPSRHDLPPLPPPEVTWTGVLHVQSGHFGLSLGGCFPSNHDSEADLEDLKMNVHSMASGY